MPIELFGLKPESGSRIPFYTMSVSAGVPVPVDTTENHVIDLNEYLVEHPAATFFARVTGDDLNTMGIHDSDIMIVDTSKEPEDRKIVLVMLNGELTVKYFRQLVGENFLESSENKFISLDVPGISYDYIGTVTKIIHSI